VFFRTQQALGITMKEIGARIKSVSLLQQSVAGISEGFDFALRETAPITWAAIQFHLAGAYLELARLGQDQQTTDLALTAIEDALLVLCQDAGPLSRDARELAQRIHQFQEGNDDNEPC